MRTVVIGAGLAGLSAAIRLLEAGQPVTLVAKGSGGLQLSQGSIDVLGYAPDRVERPLERLGGLAPSHPYTQLGAAQVRDAVAWLGGLLELDGTPDENLWLPTAIGAVRPTALVPASLAAADVRRADSFAVVGIRQVKDFPADLAAGNLARTTVAGTTLRASSAWTDFLPRRGEQDPSPIHFAQALDDPEFAERLGRLVARAAGAGDVILVPAVIGLHSPDAWRVFADAVGRPVAEVPMQPPSIPGIRMFDALLAHARGLGLRYVQGARVTSHTSDGERLTGVVVASAGHDKTIACDAVVHAPGGFESGALDVDSYGRIRERVFDLPLTASSADGLILDDPRAPQPIFEVGVRVDDDMRPLDGDGPVFTNLYAAGGILAGAQRWVEKSGDGIAVASALRAADAILGGTR